MTNRSISASAIASSVPRESAAQATTGSSLVNILRRWANRPWFAYLMLFLLQLKVIWGIWKYRDLTIGDTSSYFVMSYLWFKNYSVNLVWSPLYTAFYGQLLHLSTNAYVVTILHRVIIVFAVSMLVLAVMRRLLPPGIAWLVAAWWVILPVNFEAMYEVHLFAILPVLAAYLLILSSSQPWARGGALAILAASSVLVRNEYSIVTGLLGIICLVWELRLRKGLKAESSHRLRIRTYLISYGVPLLLAGLVVIFFYSHSVIKFPQLPEASAPKHTLNMCQVYALGYKLRHPEWNKSPWTDCYELMNNTFGKPLLSLPEMIRRNPQAVLEHFTWNIRIAPSGIQFLLFNTASGIVDAVRIQSRVALPLSILVIGIIAASLILLYRKRSYWWETWLQDRAIGWLAMVAAALVTFIIIPVEWPRPEYLFSLGILIMALTGMGIFVIAHRWRQIERLFDWVPIVMVVLILIVPSYYMATERLQTRRLYNLYRRLTPFEQLIANRQTVFLVSQYAGELSNYIVHDDVNPRSQSFDYSILNDRPPNMPFEAFLVNQKINLIYIDNKLWSMLEKNPLDQALLDSPTSVGWQPLALQNTADRWMLLQKKLQLFENVTALRQQNANPDIGPASSVQALYNNSLPADGLFLGNGWYTLETFGEYRFHWVNNDAEIVVTSPTGKRNQLRLTLEAGPGLAGQQFELQVLDQSGQIIARTNVEGRETVRIILPIGIGQPVIFRLHVEGGGRSIPKDPRTLNFRVFEFDWAN